MGSIFFSHMIETVLLYLTYNLGSVLARCRGGATFFWGGGEGLACSTDTIHFFTLSLFTRYIFLSGSVSLGTVIFCMFLVTCSPLYSENCFKVSLLLCLLLCSLSLATYLQISQHNNNNNNNNNNTMLGTNFSATHNIDSSLGRTDLSEAGLFALYVEVRYSGIPVVMQTL